MVLYTAHREQIVWNQSFHHRCHKPTQTLGVKIMKTFLISWKHNSGFQHTPSLIRGESYTEAMVTHFHKDALNAVMNYEEVKPWFMNIKTRSFQHPLPVTLYYTQHGTGKVYIKWLDGMVNEEIKAAVRITAKKSFNYINEVAKDIYDQINNG